MTVNLLALTTPIIKQVAPLITERIQNKISPSEMQQAILAGLKAAEAEEEKLPIEQHLFFKSKPDSVTGVPGFIGKYFKITAVQNELAKSFNNEGKPDTNYLVAEFKRTAESYKEVNPLETRIKPWLNTFINVYFETTSTYLKFQEVAKQDYFRQLNKRYDNIKFAGIAVSGQEEVKQLQQIFVMPDVVKREQDKTLLPEEFISEQLSPQQQLILEQKQLARLTNSSSNPILANKLLTQTPSNKAVILGAPGSGKSTLVSYFVVMLTQGKAKDLGLDSNIDWLPIVIEIRDLERNLDLKILDYLHQFAESNLSTNKLPEDFFKHWLDRGNALILLDGIDEVAEVGKRYQVVKQIESFLSQYEQSITLITSRPSGYRRDFFSTTEFPHYQLQPFDDNKIEEFINHWYDSRIVDPQESNRYKDNLNRALQKKDRIKLLAENPLLLTIIALIHRNQVDLLNQRHELYDCAVKTLLTSWDEYKYIGDKEQKINIRSSFEYIKSNDLRRFMESLAYWIHTQGNPEDRRGGTLIDKKKLIEKLTTDIQNKKRVEFYQAEEEAKNFVEFIRTRTGLLNEQGINRYASVHKTFQEYLCSQEIYYQARSKFDFPSISKAIKQHLHDSHWREVLLLLVSQLEGAIAVKAIRTILENNSNYEQWLHRDLFLAANCLAENPQDMKIADDSLGDEILQALVNLEFKDTNKIGIKISQQVFPVITSLAETDWEAEALTLLKKQKDKIKQFRFIGYQAALGEREQAITALLPLLQDDDFSVRESVAKALGNIGKAEPDVIEALLPLLQDKDFSVRKSVAKALGNIGKAEPEVIEALLPLLQDKDFSVRESAAKALGQIGKAEPEVIRALFPLLQDQNSLVRCYTAKALGQIGKAEPEVIQALLSLLQDDDSFVRYSAAEALGKIGKAEPEVIRALFPLLQDDDYSVRYFAARALGQIGKADPEVITSIENWLKQHQDTEYVGNGIDVLWNLVADAS